MFPEYLIRDWQKDRPQVPRYNAITIPVSGTVTTLNANHLVDQNYDCIIQTMCIEATAGAAQTVTQLQFRVYDKQGNFHRVMSFTPTTPRLQETLNYQGAEIFLPSGYTMRAVMSFNAGASSNSASFSLTSLLIPQTEFLT